MHASAQDQLIRLLISNGYLRSPRIIEAFYAIDRADFVLSEDKKEAYGNYPLPIGMGQTISRPVTVAFMLEALDPQPGEKILDIGSGSGWTTALLAYVVSQKNFHGQRINSNIKENNYGKVFAVDRIPEICKFGDENIQKYHFIEKGIVSIFCKDGTEGLPEYALFDKILTGAAASKNIPEAWRNQLKTGGRIVAPVDNSVWLFIKKSSVSGGASSKDQWEEKEFPGFMFVPLISNKLAVSLPAHE